MTRASGKHARREFAAAFLIGTRGQLLFQQRDDVPGIAFPGMIGLFGGHREGAETFAECVSREVHEEIGYLVSPHDFEPMTTYTRLDPDGTEVAGELFLARDIPVEGLIVTEGSLLVVAAHELPRIIQDLVPTAGTAARLFLDHPTRWGARAPRRMAGREGR